MVTTPEGLAEAFATRLRELVARDDGARQRLLARSGMPASTFGRLLAAKNLPQTDTLVKIARAAEVSLDWLTGLTNEPGTPKAESDASALWTGGPLDGFALVPTFDVRASAGIGRLVDEADAESSGIVAFKSAWLRSLGLTPGRVHLLWATGDSMVPTIRDGDMMLVDRTVDRVVDDGIYVVVAGGAVRVKRIALRQNGGVVLRSDNERYPEEAIPADEVPQLIVEGRVRWVGGPI